MADVTVVDIGGIIQSHRRWFMALGAALIVAGLLAIVFPLAGGLAVEIWTAIALLIAGGAQIAHAFAARQWQGFLLGLIVGLLYVATGAMLYLNPMRGVVTLTVLLAFAILFDGVLRTVLAFHIRPVDGWFWMLGSGLLGIVVAFMIWQQLPSSATWALGLMLGCNLSFSGLAFAGLATAARARSDGSDQRT